MSIIATVENGSIKLPPGVHVPDGTQAKVIFVPESDQTLAERYASLIGFADDLPADMAANSIALPAGIEVSEGAEVQATLPEESTLTDNERAAWLARPERRLLKGWNPDADDVYARLFTPSPDIGALNGTETEAAPSEEALPVVESGGATSWMLKYAGTVEGPSDMAAQHDHYAHGTPKRTDV